MSQILPYELFSIANAALEDSFKLEDEDSFDEFLDKLRFFFQDNLLLAALDLVDRDNGAVFLRMPAICNEDSPFIHLITSVIKFTTAWGYTQYQVLGTTSTYTVFLGAVTVDGNRKTPPYCTCASFAYSVLLSEYQLMVG
ncbi:hypothetical protein PHLCEN_2v12022 [Hermanssonia centrifuga]|uniref:Uncharacterized protein n=1 Tax=Hermanssonia centrifuga TaxID=98765 RepID=A0A2R6NI82_9APHY|nr:hypothetical protein PHLCEN_2v12022 [Hermanssonia centrifuga]